MILAAWEQDCLKRSFFHADDDCQALLALPVLSENSASMKSAVEAECVAARPSLTLRIEFATRAKFLISALE